VVRLRFATILSLALIGGCAGGSQDTTLEIVNDVCEPTTIIAPADASDEQLASIDGAIAMWAHLGFDRVARGDGAALIGGQQIPIVFDDAAEFFHGLYDDEHGVVYINRALSDDRELAITVAHELGHAFGLWHVDRGTRSSVMNPDNLAVEPNDGDAAELVALWGACR
jgi:hypothetical protein